MGNVHDVGVHLGDRLRHVGERPQPARLQVVQQVVDDGEEVGLEEVEQGLKVRND